MVQVRVTLGVGGGMGIGTESAVEKDRTRRTLPPASGRPAKYDDPTARVAPT